MEKKMLRTALLDNAKKMCEYTERELANTCNSFEYKYEYGFAYGWRDYCISMYYNNVTKKASITINFYRGRDYTINEVVKDRDGKDLTSPFLNDYSWYVMDHVEDAIMRTQSHWSSIKSAIQSRKDQEQGTFNFEV